MRWLDSKHQFSVTTTKFINIIINPDKVVNISEAVNHNAIVGHSHYNKLKQKIQFHSLILLKHCSNHLQFILNVFT